MNQRMKIPIAYDGSSHADAAIDDLRRAGLPREVEAVVVSVAGFDRPGLVSLLDQLRKFQFSDAH